MATIELDYAADTLPDKPTEAEVLADARTFAEGIAVTVAVKELVGPGGGWPALLWTGEPDALRELAVRYDGGQDHGTLDLVNEDLDRF